MTAPGGILPLCKWFLQTAGCGRGEDELETTAPTRDRDQSCLWAAALAMHLLYLSTCLHRAGKTPLVRNSSESQQKPRKEVQEQGSESDGSLCQ